MRWSTHEASLFESVVQFYIFPCSDGCTHRGQVGITLMIQEGVLISVHVDYKTPLVKNM